MLDVSKDILALTDFKRNSAELMRRMKQTRQPLVLTVNGKAELVVQTAEDYQRLMEQLEQASALAGIRRGLKSKKAGRGRPADEVFADIETRHAFLSRK